MKTLHIAVLITNLFFISSHSQNAFELTIQRQLSSKVCTMGYLVADGEVLCYTLELPWADNLNNISCVPAGRYAGILRYDKSDKWRIQLENVPNRTGVQIHIGNYTSEIKGCVLVGKEAQIEHCSVQNSFQAYLKIKKAFYGSDTPSSTPNKPIFVTFK